MLCPASRAAEECQKINMQSRHEGGRTGTTVTLHRILQPLTDSGNRLITVLLQSTGVEFPEVTPVWQGDKFRCLGAGNRKKKIAFVGVKASPG